MKIERGRGTVTVRLTLAEARALRDELLWITGDGDSPSAGNRLWQVLAEADLAARDARAGAAA